PHHSARTDEAFRDTGLQLPPAQGATIRRLQRSGRRAGKSIPARFRETVSTLSLSLSLSLSQPIKKMVDRIRRFPVLKSRTFSTLHNYPSPASIAGNMMEQIKCFHPPAFPTQGKADHSANSFSLLILDPLLHSENG